MVGQQQNYESSQYSSVLSPSTQYKHAGNFGFAGMNIQHKNANNAIDTVGITVPTVIVETGVNRESREQVDGIKNPFTKVLKLPP